ncbi:putative metal-binding motif-containing protein [Archangium lipolyticum]|uniref:putative metal-binding motif-containing protein n=1 Tax=Archangium lipolyticum TaxID=2970465 RepID=UPI002149EB7A|nr:putative metal-binding motif-containing protein [Archangium lipolyticum]
MKMTTRRVWSALLGLGLAACGPVDGTEPSLEMEAQALEAGCTSLGSHINNNACQQAIIYADNVNVTASATRSTATAPDISTRYKTYTISMPANAEGSVKFTAASTGSVVFYRTKYVPFTVVDSTTNTPVAAALTQPVSVLNCELVYASVYDLTAGNTYIVAIGPTEGNSLRVAALSLNEYRVRYYPDLDNDTYGANTGSIYTGCTPPPSYINSRRWDCDDSNASINPAAAEVCGNDIDENCDTVTSC